MMKTRKVQLLSALVLSALLASVSLDAFAGSRNSGGYVATPEDYAELERVLRQHIWYGKPITRGVRAAAGDPNLPVVDRRALWGFTYTCGFQYLTRHQRAMVCD